MSARIQVDRVSGNEIERLLPVLVHIQANLDQDLSLQVLAKRARLSPFHFHRLFRSTVGETLKQYTQRLRLERAASRLIIHDSTILDVALDSGFQCHETFSREFKRRFQVTPKSYREWGRGEMRALSAPGLDEFYNDFELSETKVARLAQLHVAFIRHVGPYETVTDILWHTLADWAKSKRLPADLTFLGIAQDAPGLTAPERVFTRSCDRTPGARGRRVRRNHACGTLSNLARGVRDYCSQDCETERLSGWRSTLY